MFARHLHFSSWRDLHVQFECFLFQLGKLEPIDIAHPARVQVVDHVQFALAKHGRAQVNVEILARLNLGTESFALIVDIKAYSQRQTVGHVYW